ncbi:hypothetical protein [Flavobacterium saccharophilum]|uniref:Uncharacterized protein n=1 Tax=Flavobacterium saccharophilum TaxID=29534 RepID=A0A1M7GCG4_9FLAO|nr:hypothetical protein [Flavobacterium saccharophilum]SHM13980.1 hypothetical protein SAMN05444366_2493 [Flavobacterium saccharophilum]
MKTLFTLGACALLSLTIFSCTNDDETSDNKSATEVKKEINPATPSYAGPDDDPVIIDPPKK